MSNDIYRDQWEYEKQVFFNGLESGKCIIDENAVFVYYPGTENTNDPRTISYTFGDNRLEDAHFSAQYYTLSYKELDEILKVLSKNGVDVEQYDIFYECTSIMSGLNY